MVLIKKIDLEKKTNEFKRLLYLTQINFKWSNLCPKCYETYTVSQKQCKHVINTDLDVFRVCLIILSS